MRQRIEVSGPGIAAMAGCLAVGGVGTALSGNRLPVVVGIAAGLFLMFSLKVVRQWERVAVLRFGRYWRLRGPGLFMLVPVVDSLSAFVDQRVRISTVTAESTLTRDTVPVNVDAIVFWLVWDAEKSILEVANFEDAIGMSAQTALRESIGRHQLAEMITNRDTLGQELQRILDGKTNPWGITVQSVEIRDVRIPQALEDAMLLAKLLRDEPGPPHHAFASYETQRRPRVEKISAMARRNSDRKKTLSPFAMHVRDFFVAHVLPALARRSWDQIYAWKIAW